MGQLVMYRPSSRPIDTHPLPEGYTIRPMQPGEEADWCYCCLNQFGVDSTDAAIYTRKMGDASVRPGHVLFVCEPGGKPVGTATAQLKDGMMPTLHYIGINEDYRGLRLSYPLMEAVLRLHIADGEDGCWLTTDDWRLPAIKSYLRMGWLPVIFGDDMRPRWAAVLGELGFTDWAALTPEKEAAEPVTASKTK